MTKETIINNTKVDKIKSIVSMLGAALIFPLAFLAFTCIFLGITYVLPEDMFIANFISSVILILFSFFPHFVFVSIVMTYHKEQNKYTIIKSVIYLLTITSMIYSVNDFFEMSINFSLFSSMLAAALFLYTDYKFNVPEWMWVIVGFGYAIFLIPIYWLMDLLIIIIGTIINSLPMGLNAFVYGFTNRMLIPFGLHSIMIPTFTLSPVGGTIEIYDSVGEVVNSIDGDGAIWMVLYTNGIKDFATSGSMLYEGEECTYQVLNNDNPAQYVQGFHPIIAFAFPMVAATYCYVNGMENGRLFLMGTILTMFSGITETTEFFFILTNPYLYLLNATIVGLSFMFSSLVGMHVWLSTGWSLDIIFFGIVPALKGYETLWYWVPIIGISLGAIYSFLFILIDKNTKYELVMLKN